MIRAVLLVLAATTGLTPALAAEIVAASKVEAVTVFPIGAEVTRAAAVTVPAGEHAMVVAGLPSEVDVESIRIEGTAAAGLEIGSVDTRVEVLNTAASMAAERRRLEEAIEAARDDIQRHRQTMRDAETERRLLEALLARPLGGAGAEAGAAPDAVRLESLLGVAAGRLKALSEAELAAHVGERRAGERIAELEARLAGFAPPQKAVTVVRVNLSATAATEATFRIRYRVGGAGWRPFYEARLAEAGGATRLTLNRKAEVQQRTTERWDDVALTLSTARTTGATAAPEVESLHVSPLPPVMPVPEAAARDSEADGIAGLAAKQQAERAAPAAPTPLPVELAEAGFETAGHQALYRVAGAVSIANDATSKKVALDSDELDVEVGVRTVPRLDSNAYLTATFTLAGEAPLLPGRVLAFRDGVYIGEGRLPLMAPGASHSLGFGVDDRIEVERVETARKQGEAGILATETVDDSAWAITVRNRHAAPMTVTVLDQMPVPTHDDITVTAYATNTSPDKTDVDGERGVVAWTLELDPGEESRIDFGYRVARPKDMHLTFGHEGR